MAVDSLAVWQSEWALLPKVSDASWKSNVANYLAARVDSKLTLATYGGTPVVFTFNKTVFLASLASVSAATGDGVSKMALGFSNAVLTAGSLVVSPGAFIGSATPATTYSAVASSVITPAGALAGKTKIEELSSAPLVTDPLLSTFPVKLREAFLLLTANISGTNSVAPTPAPLVDNGRAVL